MNLTEKNFDFINNILDIINGNSFFERINFIYGKILLLYQLFAEKSLFILNY